MKTPSSTLRILALSALGVASFPPLSAHAKTWEYCPGDCPDPEVSVSVDQDKYGNCTVEISMLAPAELQNANSEWQPVALSPVDTLTDVWTFYPSGVEFDHESDQLLVGPNVYETIHPDDDAYDPAWSAFGSVHIHTATVSAEPGDAGSAYALGFALDEIQAWEDYHYNGVITDDVPTLPTGTALDEAHWFCPLPAWQGSMELVVDVTPNDANGTCTLDASLVVTEVDGSNADADEFDLLVDSGDALEFIDLSESYVAVAGGLFDFEGSIVVEDGASGQVEAIFTDMDSNAPVSALLESAEWSCQACPEVTADLNGDGLVGAADLMVLLGVFGGTDPVADIDGDGSVGVSDLTTLLGQWGMVDCG